MRALSYRPFCSCDGRWVSLGYLSAGCRYTTKETGMDKSTISRAIKSGKLSATRQENGGYAIDPAELFRVFAPASKDTEQPVLARDTVLDGWSEPGSPPTIGSRCPPHAIGSRDTPHTG